MPLVSRRHRSAIARAAELTDDRDPRHDVDPRRGPGRAAPVRRPEPAAPAMSAEEVARLEARHLKNIRQVTSGLARAGRGLFQPRRPVDHLPGGPQRRPLDLPPAQARRGRLPDLPGPARGRRAGPDGQHGQGAMHLPLLPPERRVDPVRVDPPEPQHRGRAAQGPGLQPDRPLPLGIPRVDGHLRRRPRRQEPGPPDRHARATTPRGAIRADGSQIVFTSFRDGDGEIYIMDADGKNPRRITHAKGYDGGPFFSPDGKRIIYRSDRKGNDLLQVYVNNTEGTAERRLTKQRIRQLGPVLAPRRPPHHLCDQQARPLQLRALPDGRGHRPAKSGSPTTKASTACRSSARTASGSCGPRAGGPPTARASSSSPISRLEPAADHRAAAARLIVSRMRP